MRRHSTPAIIGLLLAGLLLACLISAALGSGWYFLFGALPSSPPLTPIARP